LKLLALAVSFRFVFASQFSSTPLCDSIYVIEWNFTEHRKNQRNIEWLVRLFINLHLDAFMLQNSKRSTKVMHQYSKYSKYILNFRCISFRFVILHFVSIRFFIFRFVSLYFVSFRCISFRFAVFRFASLYFVSLYFISFELA
jgi:hypothetical protein